MNPTKAFLSLVLSLAAGIAGAAEIRVLSSNAMREVLLEIVPTFEKASGHKLTMTILGSADILKRLRAGAPRPDISSGEALRRTLLASKSIVVSSGPSGIYMLGLFERMGIPREKYLQAKSGVQTGELVARGEAEICFQQLSELLPVKGIDFLGPLSADVGHVTVFAGGIHAAAAEAQAARALMQYLASPAAALVLRAKGMEPAQ